jgi:hypothetical protein
MKVAHALFFSTFIAPNQMEHRFLLRICSDRENGRYLLTESHCI